VAKLAASVVTVHVLAFAGRSGESTNGAGAARAGGAGGLGLGDSIRLAGGGDSVPLSVCVPVGVTLALGGGDAVGDAVGEPLGDAVGERLADAVGEPLGDGESLCEFDGLGVGVEVGATPGDGEGDAETAAAVGDGVGVRVVVLVTVAEGVRVGVAPEHDDAEITTLSMRNVPAVPSVPVADP